MYVHVSACLFSGGASVLACVRVPLHVPPHPHSIVSSPGVCRAHFLLIDIIFLLDAKQLVSPLWMP